MQKATLFILKKLFIEITYLLHFLYYGKFESVFSQGGGLGRSLLILKGFFAPLQI